MSEDPNVEEKPPGTAAADPVSALEARLGLGLCDRRLALAALTHKSYVNEHRDEADLADNERLEFLGDAVIDLAVSHRLMERFPGAQEGDLSKMRAAVVDEQGLSEMARALDLGPLLRLGRGEDLTGGRTKSSLLADAMEAVVAAVYLCSGLPPVSALIERFLGDAFARAAAGTLDRDFKTQLQELCQSRLRAPPRYRVVRELGPDHSKTFEVETEVRGEVIGRGSGRSKKDAEQAAARLALEALTRRFGAEEHLSPAPPEADRAIAHRPAPEPVQASAAAPSPAERGTGRGAGLDAGGAPGAARAGDGRSGATEAGPAPKARPAARKRAAGGARKTRAEPIARTARPRKAAGASARKGSRRRT